MSLVPPPKSGGPGGPRSARPSQRPHAGARPQRQRTSKKSEVPEDGFIDADEEDVSDDELFRALEARAQSGQQDERGDDHQETQDAKRRLLEGQRKEQADALKAVVKAGVEAEGAKSQQENLKQRDDFDKRRLEDPTGLAKLEEKVGVDAMKAVAEAQANALIAKQDRPLDAMSLLHMAQEEGHFLKEGFGGGGDGGSEGGEPQDDEDQALLLAVAEARELLAGTRGIERVSPARDERGGRLIAIVTCRGFGEAALHALPKEVRGFPLVLAIPFDILPLRRDRALESAQP